MLGIVFLPVPNYVGIIHFNIVADGKHINYLMQIISEEIKEFFVLDNSRRNKEKFLWNILDVMRVKEIRIFCEYNSTLANRYFSDLLIARSLSGRSSV